MEVSGQLHAPAALLPEKEPPVPTGWEAGWALLLSSIMIKLYVLGFLCGSKHLKTSIVGTF